MLSAVRGRVGGIVVVGLLVLVTAGPVPPIRADVPQTPPADAPVTIYGRAGTFGALRDTVPSGQELTKVEMPQWSFATARRPHRSVVAADGSVLMAGLSHNESRTTPTSAEMVIGTFDPSTGAARTIRLATADGHQVSVLNGHEVAPTVADLVPLPSGAVVFTAWPTDFGEWPVLGVLTKVDGSWGVAAQWTSSQLGVGGLDRAARLQGSGDVVVSDIQGGVVVLRFSDRFSDPAAVKVIGRYTNIKPREIFTDPTSVVGDERFVVGSDNAVQEFGYDNVSGTIRPTSAPMQGFGPGIYDHKGNLWLTRFDGKKGGHLGVFAKGKLCQNSSCKAGYDIIQGKELRAVRDLAEDPATGTIVVLGQGGILLPIRATGTGSAMGFEIGNLVDVGHKLLARTEFTVMESRIAGLTQTGRLWIATSRVTPSSAGVGIDHWLISLALQDLFSPRPVRLPSVPGQAVTIQAERTVTTKTEQRPGFRATVDVGSVAYAGECTDSPAIDGCGYDGVPGNGFYLKDDTVFGVLEGTIEYRVDVPSDGMYRLSYHVGTLYNTPKTQIQLTVGGRSYIAPVFVGGSWSTVRVADPVFIPAGLQTIQLSVPPGHGGWYLNSFTLQRK